MNSADSSILFPLQIIFLETICNDGRIIERNIRLKIQQSPDYAEQYGHYLKVLTFYLQYFPYLVCIVIMQARLWSWISRFQRSTRQLWESTSYDLNVLLLLDSKWSLKIFLLLLGLWACGRRILHQNDRYGQWTWWTNTSMLSSLLPCI